MSNLPTETSFLKDVAHHKMEVLRDDGLYRHLRFQINTSWHMSFNVVTWPGYLAFTGDMGSFIFSRCPDMLEFFRGGGSRLSFDPGYWGEKVQAADRNSGVEEYSPDKFRRRIAEWLDEAEATPELRKAVKDEVLAYADDGEHEAIRAACDFEHGQSPTFRFSDFWEVNVKEYTYRFLWCCYAVAWAVQQYDAQTTPVASGATS